MYGPALFPSTNMRIGQCLCLALYAGDNFTYLIYDEQTKRVLVRSILAPLKPKDEIDPSPYDSLSSRLPTFYWDAEHVKQIITDNSDPYSENEHLNNLAKIIRLYQNTGLAIQDSAQGRNSNKTGSNITSTQGGIEVDTEQLGSPIREVNVWNPTRANNQQDLGKSTWSLDVMTVWKLTHLLKPFTRNTMVEGPAHPLH